MSAEDGDYNQRLSFSVDDDHFRADTVVQTANGATAVIRVNKYVLFCITQNLGPTGNVVSIWRLNCAMLQISREWG